MKKEEVKKTVREAYAKVATKSQSCCAPSSSCCGPTSVEADVSKKVGYTDKDLGSVPEGSNLGLGCGNPVALASLKEGETVLDLGSGGGLDCFLAAQKVGTKGKVIGVDMTAEMIEKARENARKANYDNVEFRLGEIENLPVGDNSVDVVISNCVINLSPDKKRVFQEAYRALKPGGRLMISDITLLKELPDFVKNSKEAYVGCVTGAVMKDEYLEMIRSAGFSDVRIVDETHFPLDCVTSDASAREVLDKYTVSEEQLKEALGSVASVNVEATK